MMRFTPGMLDFPTVPASPAAAGASLISISTFTVPTSGSGSRTAWQSWKICSGTLGSRVCTSMRTVVMPGSQVTSLTRPKEMMSRENPG